MRYRSLQILLIAAAISAAAATTLAQADPKPGPYVPKPAIQPAPVYGPSTSVIERSLPVAANLTASLCVIKGNVHINGWDRKEMRVLIKDGSDFAFRVFESDSDGLAAWTTLQSSPNGPRRSPSSDCVSGDRIEVDVPFGSRIDIKGQESTVEVDSVRVVKISNVGGDASIRNVSEGVSATVYQGDISVMDSSGPASLETTTGNIVAVDLKPRQPGESFRAKTNNGVISVSGLGFRQSEISTISGTVSYVGKILEGGSYSFATTSGSIRLELPETTSSIIAASYGFGGFNTDLPMKILTEDVSPGSFKRVTGQIGGGGATVKLSTTSGNIVIKKR